jgi:hypothetical protein
MSKLSDAITAENKPPNPHQCGMYKILHSLPKSDADELRGFLADPSVAGEAIARALTGLGQPVRGAVVRAHRRRLCTCDR